MTHIEYDEFGSYEETIDLIPVGLAQNGKQEKKEVMQEWLYRKTTGCRMVS